MKESPKPLDVGSDPRVPEAARPTVHPAADVNAGSAWVRAALLVGVAYLVIGRGLALPSSHAHAWRLAAWAVSGVAYAAHMAYEHFRLRNPPRAAALHVALAVAIGALGLALVAMMHSAAIGLTIGPRWLLALVIWPAVTGVPAFLGALLVGLLLARLPRRADGER